MSNSAPVPANLPSPPAGVDTHSGQHPSWLRRTLARSIALEPADLPGRLSVAATILAGLPGIASTVLGYSVLAVLPTLFHLFTWLAWPLAAVVVAGGFMSRSRTARWLATITTVGLASLFIADSLALPTVVVSTGMWLYNAALASTVGLWAVRAFRRRFARQVEQRHD